MTIDDLKGNYKVVGVTDSAPFPPENKRDLLQTASDVGGFIFPGTKKIGESLANAGASIADLATGGVSKFEKNADSNRTSVPELAGAYTAVGASIAGTAGLGSGGGLLANALKSAGIGAAIGGGTAASEDKSVKEIAGSAAIGAGIGAGTSLASAGVEQIAKGLQALPQRLVRSATGQSKNEILAGKDISQYVIDNKRIGTADSLIKSSQSAIDDANKFINESLVSAADKQVPVKGIIDDITASINQSGGDVSADDVQKVVESLAPQVKKTLRQETISLADANKLRSQLDSTLGNRAFINAQLPYNKGILMDFTNALREQVKGLAPEGTREAFDTLSKEITLRNLLLKKVAGGSRNQIIGLGDLVSGSLGGAIGGVPGALMTAGAKRAAESTLTKTGVAVIASELDKRLSPVIENLSPAAQTAVINAIVQAFNASQSESR